MSNELTESEAQSIIHALDDDIDILCQHAQFLAALDREVQVAVGLQRELKAIDPSDPLAEEKRQDLIDRTSTERLLAI